MKTDRDKPLDTRWDTRSRMLVVTPGILDTHPFDALDIDVDAYRRQLAPIVAEFKQDKRLSRTHTSET